jgi:hypothetical protein
MANPRGADPAIPVAARRDRGFLMKTQGYTWTQIAAALGYDSAGSACKDVGTFIRQQAAEAQETREQILAVELERLAYLRQVTDKVLRKKQLVIVDGQVLTDGDGVPVEDDAARLPAVDREIKIAQRISALLGLDAPTKAEVTAKVSVEVVGVELDALK